MKLNKNKSKMATVISYVPLLYGNAGVVLNEEETKQALVVIANINHTVNGILWLTNDKYGYAPCLILDRAKEIFDHIKFWSENKPEEWFKLVITECDGRYGVALAPELEKTKERMESLSDSTEYLFLFKPLFFVSGHNHIYANIKKDMKGETKVFFLDSTEVKGNYNNIDHTKLIDVGIFRLSFENEFINYIKENIRSSTEPLR